MRSESGESRRREGAAPRPTPKAPGGVPGRLPPRAVSSGGGAPLLAALVERVCLAAVDVGLDPVRAAACALILHAIRHYQAVSARLLDAHQRHAKATSKAQRLRARTVADAGALRHHARSLEDADADVRSQAARILRLQNEEAEAWRVFDDVRRQWQGALSRETRLPQDPVRRPHLFSRRQRFSPLHGRVLSPHELSELAEYFA